jgi:hypothetical protein
MNKNQVTMVNPQQIVQKGLRGCSTSRTVTTFAQKYGVPCVWWMPSRTQKILLVDWLSFRSTWNQHWQEQKSYPTPRSTTRTGVTPRSTTYKGTQTRTTPSSTKRTWGKPTTRTYSGKTTYHTTRTTKRIRKAA